VSEREREVLSEINSGAVLGTIKCIGRRTFKILTGTPTGKRPLERPRYI